ncbi:MAG: DUF3179 domain-containing protein [Flavobacteriales bacterium]|nr:DUF3179 domain-containing protein [Flavobacteriales bacterium]
MRRYKWKFGTVIRQMSLILLASLVLMACKKNKELKEDWLIPKDEIKDGGPGKDGIPSVDSPKMVSASSISYLGDNDLVIGVKIGNDVRAYPHDILDWHEIINDGIGLAKYSIIYCPLTGTGMSWNRYIDGATTTFGVSGLLYNSNIIPYDRGSESNWSQMLLKSVNGDKSGKAVHVNKSLETTWKTWKTMYPETEVVSDNTGHNRNYGSYPYGNYKTSGSLLFSVTNDDPRLPKKERVAGVILSGNARVYRFGSFTDSTNVINDVMNGTPLVCVGSKDDNYIMIMKRQAADGTILTFEPVQDSLPIVMKDAGGSRWDVMGKAVSGPRTGEYLGFPPSFIGYWFAWGAFYPSVEIYE